MLSNLRERLSTKYRAWRRRDLAATTGDMKDHREGLEQRKQERMKRRETKLNLIAEDLQDHRAQTPSSSSKDLRKPLRMRAAKSVRYSPDTKPGQTDEGVRGQANTRTLTLSEPLEIFVDGPFGSPSSNIYRAEHAVLIGTGIGEWRIIRAN